MNKSIPYAVITVLACSCNAICADNSYIREGSIGNNNPKATEATLQTGKVDGSKYRATSTLVDERFIFMSQPKSLQKGAYQQIDIKHKSRDKYKEYVGRIARVVSVKVNDGLYNGDFKTCDIKLEMEDDHKIIQGSCIEGRQVMGIAPLADIDDARSKWKGKTLWCLRNYMFTYDEAADKFQCVGIEKCSPLKVTDVVAGCDYNKPVRFILRTEAGIEGFIDLCWSGTNSYLPCIDSFFPTTFLTDDPKTLGWSDVVWNAIRENKVFVGMTDSQVAVSWGLPDKVNKTIVGSKKSEQWIYRRDKSQTQYVHVDNGVVSAISE